MASAQDEFNDLMRDKDRRYTHPEDDEDDARSFLNLSDDEDDNDSTPAASHIDIDDAPRASMSPSRSTIPTTRYEANTGPKGVISDAQNFRDSRRSRRISMRSTSTIQSQLHDRRASHPVVLNEKLSESDEELDGLDDADFMREWRQSRLRELQNGSRDSRMHQRERSRRLWGGLTTVDGNGFLDAVEKSPSDTTVVVYIYDDYVSPTQHNTN
jgi:hypothetical protein